MNCFAITYTLYIVLGDLSSERNSIQHSKAYCHQYCHHFCCVSLLIRHEASASVFGNIAIYHKAFSLRKHAYSNIQKCTENFTTKNWKFSNKKLWYFSYFSSKHRLWVLFRTARRCGSNEYPQSMFKNRTKKNNVYTCTPPFYYIKVGFKGVKIRHVFMMCSARHIQLFGVLCVQRMLRSVCDWSTFLIHK